MEERYYYSLLNDIEKKGYNDIYQAFTEFKTSVLVMETKLDIDTCSKIYTAIECDYPLLFFADFKRLSVGISPLGTHFNLSYFYQKEEALKLKEKMDTIINEYITKVKGLDEYNKELVIHDLLIKKIIYDNDMVKSPTDDNIKTASSIVGTFIYNKAVCEGIAEAMKVLLNKVGIFCIVVRNDIHAWNIVKINNNYYHLDVTWDNKDDTSNKLNYDYFNLSDSEIIKDHELTKIENGPLPRCTLHSMNYFINNKLLVYKVQDIEKIVRMAYTHHKTDIYFRFIDKNIYTFNEIIDQAKVITKSLYNKEVLAHCNKRQLTCHIHIIN